MYFVVPPGGICLGICRDTIGNAIIIITYTGGNQYKQLRVANGFYIVLKTRTKNLINLSQNKYFHENNRDNEYYHIILMNVFFIIHLLALPLSGGMVGGG